MSTSEILRLKRKQAAASEARMGLLRSVSETKNNVDRLTGAQKRGDLVLAVGLPRAINRFKDALEALELHDKRFVDEEMKARLIQAEKEEHALLDERENLVTK